MLRTSFICFMMNNEVISLEEKIMLLINGKMDQIHMMNVNPPNYQKN